VKYATILQRFVVYGLLLVGAIVFSLPFVWMASTSVKVDRELFAGGIHFLPLAPYPSIRSPYIDQHYYDLSRPQKRLSPEMFQALLGVVRAKMPKLPTHVDRTAAEKQLVRGLYRKLWKVLPKKAWEQPPEAVAAAAFKAIDRDTVRGILDDVHRRLCFGQVRLRSLDLDDQVVGQRLPYSQRLNNETPQVARLIDSEEKGLQYARIEYDFSKGDRMVLERTVDLDFDVERLQRIQLYMRPDDTWHDLFLTVEMMGARYTAERSVPLSNSDWTMLTWQEPGADDKSTKIKTWTLLERREAGARYVHDPRKIKLIFEIRRAGPIRAWWNKLRMNYDRVLDFIPFWRYVRTSIFLVIVNIVLTLFSCSLVAYAFARLQWPGRDFCFLLLLATMMIPGQVTMIPTFLIWKNAGAYNTLTPLWLGSAFGNAFFIFLLRQFMKGIPRALEDAARIDGCGVLRIYWHIILPLIRPSLAAIAIFTFMGTWNNFMGPLIYIADQRLYPLAFGLYAFAVQVGNNPALTMAASLLMTVPVIVIFFFAQKYFIQGVTLTGMKT
jgi:ABC-type glycerol-3-phosphate transport system permease component